MGSRSAVPVRGKASNWFNQNRFSQVKFKGWGSGLTGGCKLGSASSRNEAAGNRVRATAPLAYHQTSGNSVKPSWQQNNCPRERAMAIPGRVTGWATGVWGCVSVWAAQHGHSTGNGYVQAWANRSRPAGWEAFAVIR